MAVHKKELLNQQGQTALEVLLISILSVMILGAIVGNGRDGRGVPATMKRASPQLALKIQERLETGSGFRGGRAGSDPWQVPPKE